MIDLDEVTQLLYKLAGGQPYKETKSHTCVKEFTPDKMLEKQALPFVLTEIPQLKR